MSWRTARRVQKVITRMTKTNEKRNFPRRLSAAGVTRSRTDCRKLAGTDFGTGDVGRERLLSLGTAAISFNFPWGEREQFWADRD